MKNFLLTVLAFGLLSSSAFAQEGLEQKQFTRVVPSGKKSQLGFFTSLHADCTSRGDADIRIIKQPEHGSIETVPTTSFPGYAKEHVRYKCNQHKVKGVQVNYKSAWPAPGSEDTELGV
jgi:hypothetical protein